MILNALRDIFPRSGWKSFLKGRAKSTAESLLMMPNMILLIVKKMRNMHQNVYVEKRI